MNGRATLSIKKVEKVHEGIYYCYAENEYGKAVLSCNLRVIDAAYGRTESVHEMMRIPLKYALSETEAEVSSNVHVTHTSESFEHHFAMLLPEAIALGYTCIASTSQVHDDSVILTRESAQSLMERQRIVEGALPEAYAALNVNVERAPAHFAHDARIIQPISERAVLLRQRPQYTRTEEVIQASDINLVEERRIMQQYQSTVNATTTVVLEKPIQRAVHEVRCLYDEKLEVSKERIKAVCEVELKEVEQVNELISSVMVTEAQRQAHAVTNVDVRRPDAVFDHVITVVESEREHLDAHLLATLPVQRLATTVWQFQQPQQSLRTEVVHVEFSRRLARAEQRIVILESLQQRFTEAITWNLRKIRKEAAESGLAAAHTSIEVRRPEDIGEHTTTIVDTRSIVAELLAIAAAASKLKVYPLTSFL
ncbi:unnamed protein product [Gongylonema pulchrum]|uniref:Ig-like domain-containing protein n=1 Tax=Gongylonema pulchrum TaxID=637853 RepID=A0A183DRY7_9BILA|nr:unnamed protein product [Gongylonema pulchrum]